MSTRALVTGSFDPITLGHFSVIEKCAHIFDEVYVIAFINEDKEYMFEENEREEMLELSLGDFENVKTGLSHGLVADYAKEHDIDVIVRGIRNYTDMKYENEMAEINYMNSGVETIYIRAKKEYSRISSSRVRKAIESEKKYSHLVPSKVAGYIQQKKVR